MQKMRLLIFTSALYTLYQRVFSNESKVAQGRGHPPPNEIFVGGRIHGHPNPPTPKI